MSQPGIDTRLYPLGKFAPEPEGTPILDSDGNVVPDVISEAVLAERERCAKIADQAAAEAHPFLHQGRRQGALSIAAKIRSGE